MGSFRLSTGERCFQELSGIVLELDKNGGEEGVATNFTREAELLKYLHHRSVTKKAEP